MAEEMFRPPINRSIVKLDRGLFNKTVQIKAARIFDDKLISSVRTRLQRSKDILFQDRIANVRPDPEATLAAAGKKCVLLRPTDPVRPDVPASDRSQSSVLNELISQGLIEVVPFDLELKYDYWTYHDIISSILPEDEQGEIPSGFTQTGHVAHLNIRDEYLPYKYLIGQVLMDKNSSVRTVINKINDVGEENEYRTFKYEVLAGEDDMNVTISEEDCTFHFDFSKVYWNSRLNTEHRRMVNLFKKGEAVCDVMAGIGPFAVPAGKKKVFVWANDLNPDSYRYLELAVTRNKVEQFVKPFNTDGRDYIRSAVAGLWNTNHEVQLKEKTSRQKPRTVQPVFESLRQPKTFQHFVMNLPASALSFLPSFIGSYPPEIHEKLPEDHVMPLVHVYCFNTKSDDNAEEAIKICDEISSLLQHPMKQGSIEDGGVQIHDVRDVAPKKRMFCASFRLPKEVAFG